MSLPLLLASVGAGKFTNGNSYVEEIPGINSQGETLDEAKENLADAINFYFEEIRLNTSQTDQNSKAIKQKQN